MVMTFEEFEEFRKQKQLEIDKLGDKINSILNEVGKEAQKIFDEKGLDGFSGLWYPEYYGVTSMSIPGKYDSIGVYFHPEGNDSQYEGWVSSSETC